MVLVNALEKANKVTNEDYKTLLSLVCPFAPHTAEEMWQQMGYENRVDDVWPKYNEEDLKEELVEIAVQVNSKIIDRVMINPSLEQDAIVEEVKSNDKIRSAIEGKNVVKAIYVPGRIVNLIVK